MDRIMQSEGRESAVPRMSNISNAYSLRPKHNWEVDERDSKSLLSTDSCPRIQLSMESRWCWKRSFE